MPPPSAVRQLLGRVAVGITIIIFFKWAFLDSKTTLPPGEIAHSGILERISSGVSMSGQALDPRHHSFLQSRQGRRDTIPLSEIDSAIHAQNALAHKGAAGKGAADGSPDGTGEITEQERMDLFDTHIAQGQMDFWRRFQLPFATNQETVHLDEQVVKGVVDELMSFNGWAAAACSSLTRPFAKDRKDDDYADLTNSGQLYYFALVVHSADHFLIDQVATIVQLSKRLGPSNVFVSLIDYASTDSTPFLSDMTEMMFTILGISFRIKRIPPMTKDPAAAYYPLEESYTRNLAMEPLMELYHRRKVRFAKVIWLKGFTCPSDVLETLRIANVNKAAMTCSMDWKEHNGFFIYNDRWRTRDMDGNLFRGSKSTSPIDEAPPRDAASIKRYAQHLPFQVFCCESGTHIIDPIQSFYHGITYRSSIEHGIFNISAAEDGKAPKWSEGPCMDSSQMHFCRDLWMLSAREGVKADAKKAKEREKKGLPRGISEELEKIVKVVAPQYAPAEKGSGGYFLSNPFGRKRPASDDPKLKNDDEGEEDEDEDNWEEEGDGPAVPGDAAGTSAADAKAQEEKKEQAMNADKAAAALPEGAAGRVAKRGLVEDRADSSKLQRRAEGDAKEPAEAEKADDGKPPLDAKLPEAEKAEAPGQAGAPPVPAPAAEQEKKKPLAANPQANKDSDAGKKQKGSVNGADLDELEKTAPKAPDSPKDDKNAPNKDASGKADAPAVPKYDPMNPPMTGTGKNRALKNGAFTAARILVNPRCVTTYAGVSHTQLALDLFGDDDDEESLQAGGGRATFADDMSGINRQQSFSDKYAMREFGPAAETFVCQEMRTTGGRSAPKQQRRTGFSIARGLVEGWQPR